MPGERLLKVREVGDRLNLKPWCIYQKIAKGEMPVTRLGRVVRIREADLDEYIASRTTRPDSDGQPAA
jgi:excisionase family DNA binding protein